MGNVYFLVIDIGQKLSGVEMSAVQRINAFNKIGLAPTVTTFAYNPEAAANLENLKLAGRFSGDYNFLNIYDFYQEVELVDQNPSINFGQTLELSNSHQVENSHDLYLYDSQGTVIGFCKKSLDGTHVEFINHIIDGKLHRRETFDHRGFLSRVDHLKQLDGFEVALENYLRPDGTVAITKICRIENGISVPEVINLVDASGASSAQFTTEEDFHAHWLESVSISGEKDLFIVDRVLEYLPAVKKAIARNGSESKVVPVVHSLHTAGDPFATINNNFYDPMLKDLPGQDAVVVHTAWQSEELQARYGKSNVHVIPHSFDPISEDEFLPVTQRTLDVVYVARYSPEKNHRAAIEIFKLVINAVPNAKLHFYGFGADKDAIAGYIADQHLSDSIFVNDFVAEVAGIYKNAKMSILTSDVEGFALCVLESLAFGCPTISFDVRYGPSSMIEDGVNGYIIQHSDYKAFADKIIRTLVDQKLNEKLASQALDLAKRFSVEQAADKWQKLIAHIS